MRGMRKFVYLNIIGLILMCGLVSPSSFAQQGVELMAMADGTKVFITQAQFDALVKQPGIAYAEDASAPQVSATQIAIPVPFVLSPRLAIAGGFIVGEPAAIAAATNAVGVTPAAIGPALVGGTATAGGILIGASAAGAQGPPK